MNSPKKISRSIAKILITIGVIKFKIDNPITFTSGILSPIYIDNRILPSFPYEWSQVLYGFKSIIQIKEIETDVLAGVASAGIPHSAGLGLLLQKSSVFIRKEPKGHGTKKMIEGGSIEGKKVLLIEDHISTGGSVIKAINYLRQDGAIINNCLSITSYNFTEAINKCRESKISLTSLTTINDVLDVAYELEKITAKEKKAVSNWLKDPRQWTNDHS